MKRLEVTIFLLLIGITISSGADSGSQMVAEVKANSQGPPDPTSNQAKEKRLKEEARQLQKQQLLKQNVQGFLGILQNPANSEDDRKTAAKYLQDLVDKLRMKKYKLMFKELLKDIQADLDKQSESVCQNYGVGDERQGNFEACIKGFEVLLTLFLTQHLTTREPTYDNIRKLTQHFLEDKIEDKHSPSI